MKSPQTSDHPPHFRFYDFFYRVCRFILCPAICRLFRFHGQKLPGINGPMLVLCNHNTDVDFLLLGSVCSRPMDFVATESMLRMGWLARFAANHLHPILHDKGSAGVGTVVEMIRRMKAGRNVVLFPEGNRSFDGLTCPIPKATGSLARMAGATLVLYRLSGGYFTTPRWGKGIRRGRMAGEVTGIFSPEELKAMTSNQVQRIIEEGLWEDACARQEMSPAAFRSRRGAEHLETLLFLCPSCGRFGSLHSRGKLLQCDCGQELFWSPYGYLEDSGGTQYTIAQLVREQQTRLQQILEPLDDRTLLWSDPVICRRIDHSHNILEEKEISLAVYRDHLVLKNKDSADDTDLSNLILEKASVKDLSVVQKNRLGLHIKRETDHYEFMGSCDFNAVKYRVWHQIHLKQRAETGDQAC